ncbi:MAG: trypsin-like peptidase domain-containing protein [Nitrososphaeraceae archaeon]
MSNRRLTRTTFKMLLILIGLTFISLAVLPSSFIQYAIIAHKGLQQKVYNSIAPFTSTDPSQTNQTANQQIPPFSSSSSLSLTDIFKRVENSVVQITTTISNPNEIIIINGKRLSGNSTALGSGFIYDGKGHIVTNNHVVPDAFNITNKVVDVAFTDGNTYQAKVMGRDPFSDIAVLQLIGNFSDEKLVSLPITNSSNLQVGQQVIAIGNPFGLSGSMTTGIISQIARLLPNPDTGYSIANTIQTNAAINPGNSGGPLLNMQGQVIGMNTAIISDSGTYSGVGFAIPSDDIARVVPKLIQNGSYSHPWLGIAGGKIPSEVYNTTGLPKNYKGVMIAAIQARSPADKAGLRGLNQTSNANNNISSALKNRNSNRTINIPDIIVAIDGHPVRQIDDIINYLDGHKSVGDTLDLKINRNGRIMDITTTLEARHITSLSSTQNQSLEQAPPELPQIPGLP